MTFHIRFCNVKLLWSRHNFQVPDEERSPMSVSTCLLMPSRIDLINAV